MSAWICDNVDLVSNKEIGKSAKVASVTKGSIIVLIEPCSKTHLTQDKHGNVGNSIDKTVNVAGEAFLKC